jgi:hypothetical protein
MQSDHAQQQQTRRQNQQHLGEQRSIQTLTHAQLSLHVSEHEWIVFHTRSPITLPQRMSNSV